jgi:hypothetical protein
MTSPLPIACSLSATDFPRRLAEVAELGRAALVSVHRDSTHAELRFAAGDGIRERVGAFAAAESECCAFLMLRVADEPGVVLLTIDAPDDAAPVLAELVEAFR